jgi:hypothetical protein
MGTRAKEVQLKMPMVIIVFRDNPCKHLEHLGNCLRFKHLWRERIRAELVQEKGCCIATVRRMGRRSDHEFVNSLFQIAVLGRPGLGMPIASVGSVDFAGGRRIRACKLERSASVTGASSLLAAFTRGHRGGRPRALQKSRAELMRQQTSEPGERIAWSEDAPIDRRKRYWFSLDHVITGLWVALLLSVIAYALIEGEAVMAELDGLDLVAAHSISP